MSSEDSYSAKSIPIESTTVKHRDPVAEKTDSSYSAKTSIVIRTHRPNPYFDEVCEYWRELWRTQLGIRNPDFTGITPFAPHPGYRPLILPKHERITAQRLYDMCRERFNCWKYTNNSLDTVVVSNRRDPRKGAYVAWFRDRVEADEELRNFSALELEKRKIPGITLLEREVLEYDYFNRTKGHLDIDNMTICSGSRYLCGDLPRVRWDGKKFFIHWFFTDRTNPILRSRQLFSL